MVMSKHIFMSLVPFWIGIVVNVLLSIFHLAAIGHDNKFLRWYFLGNTFEFIFWGMWICLIAWSIFNLVIYK